MFDAAPQKHTKCPSCELVAVRYGKCSRCGYVLVSDTEQISSDTEERIGDMIKPWRRKPRNGRKAPRPGGGFVLCKKNIPKHGGIRVLKAVKDRMKKAALNMRMVNESSGA